MQDTAWLEIGLQGLASKQRYTVPRVKPLLIMGSGKDHKLAQCGHHRDIIKTPKGLSFLQVPMVLLLEFREQSINDLQKRGCHF